MMISTPQRLSGVSSVMYVLMFVSFPSPVNELRVLSDDCRYLVLLAKIQNKVDKKEEALLSLEKVSTSLPHHGMKLNFIFQTFHSSAQPWPQIQAADCFCIPTVMLFTVGLFVLDLCNTRLLLDSGKNVC